MTIKNLPRFYHPNPDQPSITLNEEESAHAKVLRLKPGENIHLINGYGQLYLGIIEQTGKNLLVGVKELVLSQSKAKRTLILAVAPTKNNQRIEWLLEKITEMGASSFIPIICEHSEKTHLKAERLHRIALSAIKQSKNLFLPEIQDPIKFKNLMNMSFDHSFIAHCHEGFEKQNATAFSSIAGSTLICIGPEGDFSKSEVELSIAKGFSSLDLGERRLRTETAALVASVLFQFS